MQKKQTSQNSYLQQIQDYYSGQLRSYNEIRLGITPAILQQYGAKNLPMVVTQRTLSKCVRQPRGSRSAHALTRDLIDKIPEFLEKPVFVAEEKDRNSLVVISDKSDQNGNYILLALRLEEEVKGKIVNELKSVYGKENLKLYLEKHLESNTLHITNRKEAERISRFIGLQLPQALKSSDYNMNISPNDKGVKSGMKKSEFARLIRKAGFQPTKTLIKNMLQLQNLAGRGYQLQELHSIAKNQYRGVGTEEKGVMQDIVKECRDQETHRKRTKTCTPER